VKKKGDQAIDGYPISNNMWVSHVQIVSKKFGGTIIQNKDNELVPTSGESV